MEGPAQRSNRYRFGAFEFDPRTGELRGAHGLTVLPQQPAAILCILLEHPGDLVSREELVGRLWAAGTFVDFDRSLNKAVNKLRDALGDSPEEPEFIETLPRRGYRFIAPVTNGEPQPTADAVPSLVSSEPDYRSPQMIGTSESRAGLSPSTGNPPSAKGSSLANWPYRRRVLYGSVLVLLVLALGLGLRWFKGQRVVPHAAVTERQLTYNPSETRLLLSAISPDGKYLAYTDTKGLHLSVIETGESHDIPLPEELRIHVWGVSWFPDGGRLLVSSDSVAEGMVIWETSVFGGAPRKLRTHSSEHARVSPQGSSIAFITGEGREIWVMGANGENPTKVLASENENDLYSAVAWSPSGKRVAYVKAAGSGIGGSIETVSLDGGRPSTVISNARLHAFDLASLLWMPDERLVFGMYGSIGNFRDVNLWGIQVDERTGNVSGKPTKMTNWNGVSEYSPTVSRDGSRLAIIKAHFRHDVYVGEIRQNGTHLDAPKRITFSESYDYPSAWTPDSRAILFLSDRTGKLHIYKQQLDQDTAESLSQGPDEENGAQLTPDGVWILYWSLPPNDSVKSQQLLRSPVAGGGPVRVLETPIDASIDFHCPSRPEGRCFLSQSEGGNLVFYVLDPVQGKGKEATRTKLGRTNELIWDISLDGSQIALASWDQLPEQVRILDLRNGAEHNLRLPHDCTIVYLSWAADGNALFAAAENANGGGYKIIRIDLRGGIRVLLDRGRDQSIPIIVSSPDGSHLAFSQQTEQSNAWLLENF